VKNCRVLTDRLQARGFRIPYGGTDTHLTNLDCTSVTGPGGAALSGDQAARILDIAGIVVNRNTIPGDASAAHPSGIRLGTPWVTQRGLDEGDMNDLADVIADLLMAATPFNLEGRKGELSRAKVDFSVLEDARLRARALAEKAGIDYEPGKTGYPHFYYLDDYDDRQEGQIAFDLLGEDVREFVNYAVSSDAESLQAGQSQPTRLYTPAGEVEGVLSLLDGGGFRLTVPGGRLAGLAAAWLRSLSDGYVSFDEDLLRKLPGPVVVKEASGAGELPAAAQGEAVAARKPYFVGIQALDAGAEEYEALPQFSWTDQEGELRRTPLFETHKKLGAKVIPFAGWEMPVWYTSVVEEHLAVRQAAGLFDVAHMGVYQAEGPDAVAFLDSVTGNDIASLEIGESLYTHFLDPEASVIDDLLVYRRGQEKYLVVVNASNDDKDWAWLNAVRAGEVRVDQERPWARAYGREVILRNLRDPAEGADMRVDIAIQGPKSRDILLALGVDHETRKRILALKRTQLCEAVVGGFDLVVSRTGYTGEKMAFELFVHPDQAAALFEALLSAGEPYGLKPCGLGARDSLRTEAGLPLYGHEMGAGSIQRGDRDLGVAEGGFGAYVKPYKPWFIGRQAYLAREAGRKGVVARFRFNEKGVRMAHGGDPVADKRGRVIGWVTSCAVDSQGYLTGQAYLDLKSAEEGTPILIYQGAPGSAGKAPAELLLGDRLVLPSPATVVSRFPK
jgi:glycine hydroxymethyltransferase